ncbi:Cullin binding domain containing protein [Naviculisporaceae sp. PSN 640]
MTSREKAPDTRSAFLGLFTSCFHKRQDRSRVQTLQQKSSEDSSGTDDSASGDPSPQSRFQPPPRIQPGALPTGQHQPDKAVAIPPAVHNPKPTKREDMDKLRSKAKWLPTSKAKSVVYIPPLIPYFNSADSGRGQGENIEAKLNAIYDSFLDEEAKTSHAPAWGMDSFQAYFQQLGVSLEEETSEIHVVLYITHTTTLGKLARRDFVEAWTQAYHNEGVKPDITAQRQYLHQCMTRFKNDPDFFKQVYRHAFVTGKEEAQKALEKDTALGFWDTLFGPQGRPWKTKRVNWLKLWQEFLKAKWTRSVNKDMWNQTLVFAEKTMQDDTLSFWSENDSWPGVIDEFVEWCRENAHASAPAGDGMEVDN